jgi:predicted Zn-ribbon and HTH transcriptional regulator
MRCNNCGWENQSENSRCDKCKTPLTPTFNQRGGQDVPSPENNILRKTVREGFENVNSLKKTIRETDNIEVDKAGEVVVCENCSYPVRSDDKSCPNCGHETGIKSQPTKPVAGGTIDPWSMTEDEEEEGEETKKNACSLLLIAHNNETAESQPVLYSGNEIILNRDNTEKDNYTITSKEQAALTYENGKWFIEDKSAMQTTFLYVDKKKEIQSGDIIVLGNRRFIFNNEE